MRTKLQNYYNNTTYLRFRPLLTVAFVARENSGNLLGPGRRNDGKSAWETKQNPPGLNKPSGVEQIFHIIKLKNTATWFIIK